MPFPKPNLTRVEIHLMQMNTILLKQYHLLVEQAKAGPTVDGAQLDAGTANIELLSLTGDWETIGKLMSWNAPGTSAIEIMEITDKTKYNSMTANSIMCLNRTHAAQTLHLELFNRHYLTVSGASTSMWTLLASDDLVFEVKNTTSETDLNKIRKGVPTIGAPSTVTESWDLYLGLKTATDPSSMPGLVRGRLLRHKISDSTTESGNPWVMDQYFLDTKYFSDLSSPANDGWEIFLKRNDSPTVSLLDLLKGDLGNWRVHTFSYRWLNLGAAT